MAQVETAYMTWKEVEAARERGAAVLIPIGTHEQNGTLGPMATDGLLVFEIAKKIAAAVRHSSGGFHFVKAMGVSLEDRGIVQVSMNLTNYEKTPAFRVFEAVKREAERYGVSVLESEIIGLVPAAALLGSAEYYLQIGGFTPEQVLETRLQRLDDG